jgi:DNA-directed RNA polymerase specialized sigma24 family protein
MGDTGGPNGEPRPPDAGAARSRWWKQGPGQGAEGGTGRLACPSLDALYGSHYRSLFRLAALLTCDTRSAESVVQDSFAALHRLRKTQNADEGGLARLQRLVVARARRAARYGRLADGRPSAGRPSGGRAPGMAGRSGAPREALAAPGDVRPAPPTANGASPSPGGTPSAGPGAPPFEESAVVRALRTLPAGQREAVVLTLYLRLTHEQAAAAMQVSPAEMRRDLAAGRTALRAALPGG